MLGDVTHLPPGRLLGITLPHVLDFNRVGCEEKLAEIGSALGERTDGQGPLSAAEQAVATIRRLLAVVELEESLSDHGITEAQLDIVADRVYAQHEARSAYSPRGFRSRDEVMDVLRLAY